MHRSINAEHIPEQPKFSTGFFHIWKGCWWHLFNKNYQRRIENRPPPIYSRCANNNGEARTPCPPTGDTPASNVCYAAQRGPSWCHKCSSHEYNHMLQQCLDLKDQCDSYRTVAPRYSAVAGYGPAAENSLSNVIIGCRVQLVDLSWKQGVLHSDGQIGTNETKSDDS